MGNEFHAFCGVGIQTETLKDDSGIKVTSPYSGNPAERAGIKAGDIITAVMEHGGEWQPIQNNTDAVEKIRGMPGTDVTLRVQDISGQLREISITRQIIVPANVDRSTVVADPASCGMLIGENHAEPIAPLPVPTTGRGGAIERI